MPVTAFAEEKIFIMSVTTTTFGDTPDEAAPIFLLTYFFFLLRFYGFVFSRWFLNFLYVSVLLQKREAICIYIFLQREKQLSGSGHEPERKQFPNMGMYISSYNI